MKIIKSPTEMTAWSNQVDVGQKIALVPTMGCFHAGHFSLMRKAKELADFVVVSLFVNPTQFGPNEDFDNYPNIFNDDKIAAEKEGVDLLFVPLADDIYLAGHQSLISVQSLTKGLCGKNRPGHFEGVTTVVGKLFNIVKPQLAIFGEKDLQQLAVIRRMVLDLNFDVEIIGHSIVREHDGLAMSSRNVYLSDSERQSALRLSQLILYLQEQVRGGCESVEVLLVKASEYLLIDKLIKIEYVEIVNDRTLQRQELVDKSTVMAVAVKIGKTRLIDNSYLVTS
jgi:pantoate--beta-alanine ligase